MGKLSSLRCHLHFVSAAKESLGNIPREVEKTKLKDDLCGGPVFNLEFQNNYCSGGKLFSFVEAITLKKYIAGEEFAKGIVQDPKRKRTLKNLLIHLKRLITMF